MAYETDSSAGATDLGGSYSGARWSVSLARPPQWLQDSGDPDVIAWYHDNVFNRVDIDPNATLDRIESDMRSEANRLGVRLPADSGGVFVLYAMLQLGSTSWAHIAGTDGSAAPSGAGALAAPLLDVIGQQQDAALAAYRADPNNPVNAAGLPEESDTTILAALHLTNGEINVGAAIPALSPVPAPQERSLVAVGQSGYTGNGGMNLLSSFDGFGVSGGVPRASSGAALPAPSSSFLSSSTLLVIALLAGVYLLLKGKP